MKAGLRDDRGGCDAKGIEYSFIAKAITSSRKLRSCFVNQYQKEGIGIVIHRRMEWGENIVEREEIYSLPYRKKRHYLSPLWSPNCARNQWKTVSKPPIPAFSRFLCLPSCTHTYLLGPPTLHDLDLLRLLDFSRHDQIIRRNGEVFAFRVVRRSSTTIHNISAVVIFYLCQKGILGQPPHAL